jgi:hypothetical protein
LSRSGPVERPPGRDDLRPDPRDRRIVYRTTAMIVQRALDALSGTATRCRHPTPRARELENRLFAVAMRRGAA